MKMFTFANISTFDMFCSLTLILCAINKRKPIQLLYSIDKENIFLELQNELSEKELTIFANCQRFLHPLSRIHVSFVEKSKNCIINISTSTALALGMLTLFN